MRERPAVEVDGLSVEICLNPWLDSMCWIDDQRRVGHRLNDDRVIDHFRRKPASTQPIQVEFVTQEKLDQRREHLSVVRTRAEPLLVILIDLNTNSCEAEREREGGAHVGG